MDMEDFCWMCGGMWVGAVVLVVLLIFLLLYLLKWKKKK